MTYAPPPSHRKWEMPADPDLVAAIKMLAADDEDNAEACLDDAGSSREGDEFDALPPASAWMEPEPRQIADARCARCSEGETIALWLSGMDEGLLKLSNGLLFERRQMMLEALSDLMAVRQALVETL